MRQRNTAARIADYARRIERLEIIVQNRTVRHPLTTKGDIITGNSGGDAVRQPVGSNLEILTSDDTETTGLRWAAGSAALLGRYAFSANGNAYEIPTGVWRRVALSTEWIDNANLHAGTSGIIDIPGAGAGLWLIKISARIGIGSGYGPATIGLRIVKNGSALTRTEIQTASQTGGVSGRTKHAAGAWIIELAGGDTIAAEQASTSGGVWRVDLEGHRLG